MKKQPPSLPCWLYYSAQAFNRGLPFTRTKKKKKESEKERTEGKQNEKRLPEQVEPSVQNIQPRCQGISHQPGSPYISSLPCEEII